MSPQDFGNESSPNLVQPGSLICETKPLTVDDFFERPQPEPVTTSSEVRSSISTTSEPDKKEYSRPDIKPKSEKGVNDTKLSELLPAEELERQEVEESNNPQGEEGLKLNYSNLEKSLRTKDWKEADEETFILLLESLDRSKKSDLINFSVQAIENLSDEVLSQIDRLWKQYSHGQFGFSKQREIYLSLDSHRRLDITCNSEEWNDFCNRIGWRKQNRWVSLNNLYKTLNPQNFEGCLPSYRLFTKDKNDCDKYKLRKRFRLLLSKFQC